LAVKIATVTPAGFSATSVTVVVKVRSVVVRPSFSEDLVCTVVLAGAEF
jgi:hypothetical protein